MTSVHRNVKVRVGAALIAAATLGLLAAPAAQAAPSNVTNPNFETGDTSWNAFSTRPFGGPVITSAPGHPARSGSWKAELGGHGVTGMDRISQQITIPADRVPILTFWLRLDHPTPSTLGYHELTVEATAQDGTPYTLTTRTNKDSNDAYQKVTLTLPDAFFSTSVQNVGISLFSVDDNTNRNPFLVDDVSMSYQIKWTPLPKP